MGDTERALKNTENCQNKGNRVTRKNFQWHFSVFSVVILLSINKGDLFFSVILSVILSVHLF